MIVIFQWTELDWLAMLVLTLLVGKVDLHVAGWRRWSNLYECIFNEFFQQYLKQFLMILHLLCCTKAGSDKGIRNSSRMGKFVRLSSAVV